MAAMEITKISDTGFKVRGKKMTVVSDPVGKSLILSGPERKDFVVPGPGEFEIGEVGVFAEREIYRVVLDEVSICFFGDYGKKLEQESLDKIGSVDILLVSADIDAETVAKLEPMVVIPCGGGEAVQKFAKEMGHEGTAAQPKYVISKEKLPETTTAIILE